MNPLIRAHQASRLRLAQRASGLSSEAIAEALNIPITSWKNYRRGVAMPPEVLYLLGKSLNMNLHWILCGDPLPPPPPQYPKGAKPPKGEGSWGLPAIFPQQNDPNGTGAE